MFLIKGITNPARWLNQRGVFLPEPDYRNIPDTAFQASEPTAKKTGIRHFGVYFLDCIQKHIKHYADVYYDRAKGLQAKATLSMADISRAGRLRRSGRPPPTDHLAALIRS